MSVTWEEFVATHASAVLTAAMRVLASSPDADDVAQEVFVEVFHSGKFAQLHDQGALLRTMATRRALDRLRRRKPSVELNGSEASRSEFEPYEYLIADELERRLRRSLIDLPRREAEVFCLIHFEEYSQAEVSRMLGISTGAVAKALCKARGRLSVAFGCSSSETQR
jgi:RNA polymerase sigma-70 factor (ECF subfamily)